MGLAVSIIPTIQKLNLEDGKGEITFTVTNSTGRMFKGNLKLEPQDASAAGWFQLEGAAQRSLSADGTEKVLVRVLAPAGAKASTIQLCLRVDSEDNPDEEWTRSPTVEITLPDTPPPTQKPFPWWVIAVAVGLLAVVGIVIAVVLQPRAAGLHEKCGEKIPCEEKLTCVEDRQECLLLTGEPCKEGSMCATDSCRNGKCSSLNVACTDKTECGENEICANVDGRKSCRLPTGAVCETPQQCSTGFCAGSGLCAAEPQCTNDGDCGPRGVCQDQHCYLQAGAPCDISGRPFPCVVGTCEQRFGRTVCSSQACSTDRRREGMTCPDGSVCGSAGRCLTLKRNNSIPLVIKKEGGGE